jgi:repressor LexA
MAWRMTTQELIYRYIKEYIAEEGYPPDYREIASDCSISLGSVTYHLDNLEANGYIKRQPRKSRSMALTDKQFVNS